MKLRFYAFATAILLYITYQYFFTPTNPVSTEVITEKLNKKTLPKTLKKPKPKKSPKPKNLKKITSITKLNNSLNKNKKKSLKYLRSKNLVTFTNWKGFAVFDDDIIIGQLSDSSLKNGIIEIGHSQKWESPIIGYHFHNDLPKKNREEIQKAFSYFSSRTPLRFTTAISQGDSFLHFVPVEEERKCASFLGRQDGGQNIFLGAECDYNSVIHEVMHALGFIHEHSRFDRDQFLVINWDNVLEGKWEQFAFIPEIYILREQLDQFDARSRMIYPPLAFSKNGQPTIESLNKNHYSGPVTDGLSDNDIERLRHYFE